MPTTDPRIDTYIGRAAPFAQPILDHLRAVVHAADPGVEETIKWSMPFFMHEGRILAHMAAFKQHCAFSFWRGRGVDEQSRKDDAMGQFGRLGAIADLPAKRELTRMIKQAIAQLGDAAKAVEAPPAAKRAAPKAALAVPPDLAAALARDDAARANFDAFSPSQRREYIEWLLEAKRDETRAKRLAQTMAWLSEGKTRNWKYQNC